MAKTAKYALALVLALNWKSLPTVHHLRLILYYAQFRWRQARFDATGRRPAAVGQHPLRVASTTRHLCQIDECDAFGFHKNNASYSVDFDLCRFEHVLQAMSPLMATGGYGIASGKAYTFLREIRPYTQYQVEIRFAAWDSRWIYFLASFVSTDPNGKRRLHAMALERTFLFMGKGVARTSVTKALALCGLGEVRGGSNWDEAKRLEKEGKLNDWLAGKAEARIEADELEEIQRGEENQSALAKCEAIFSGKTWQSFSQRSEAKL